VKKELLECGLFYVVFDQFLQHRILRLVIVKNVKGGSLRHIQLFSY
jgi:hypothetical protein